MKAFCKQFERRTYLLVCLLFTVVCIHWWEARSAINIPTFSLYDNAETVQAAAVWVDPLFLLREELADSLTVRSMLFSPQEYVKKDRLTLLDQAVDILWWIWAITDGKRIITESWYKDVIVSRAEAIKTLVLVKTLRTPVTFNELIYHDWASIYDDMRRDAWYTSYVLYAHSMWWLADFENDWLLKPLSPLTQDDYAILIENMWWENIIRAWKHSRFMTKKDFLESIVWSFNNELKPILILYGNNSNFYQMLIKSIIWKEVTEQKEVLTKTLNKFTWFSEDALLLQQGFSRYGIVLLIETILEE